ncbi:hypothetical protein KIN20_030481 [Parelaphostrongylus tenuis]|uniref:Uncharacterized protein n=1 Tax=Parelaphostrongylus tenuis TaxID=148309 RepID=A0AAD5R491_PARTN|nr:hypothetical protein KIN20_030481 [Parelaphostrongylus tenuis]
MVYTGKTEVSAQAAGIASDRGGARAFVQRIVMQTQVCKRDVDSRGMIHCKSRKLDYRSPQPQLEKKCALQVFDVLESQARSALLPDAIISAILDQLTVSTTYEPMECQVVAITLKEASQTRTSSTTLLSIAGECWQAMGSSTSDRAEHH